MKRRLRYPLWIGKGERDGKKKKTRKVKPRYAVNVSMQAWDIAKAGAAMRLKVRGRSGLLGTIQIGQGTFGWMSARGKSGFTRFTWKELATILDENS
jgi:uncharacterized membrane protein